MPELIKNVLINGKVVKKGKNISAANVKKLELGDHLFAKAQPASEESSSDDAQGSDAQE